MLHLPEGKIKNSSILHIAMINSAIYNFMVEVFGCKIIRIQLAVDTEGFWSAYTKVRGTAKSICIVRNGTRFDREASG